MKFDRAALNRSVISLLRSSVPADRCIGRNFLIEENVSERRRVEMEAFLPVSRNVMRVAATYFIKSVQGEMRGHVPSTFIEKINHLAVIPMTAIHPDTKLVRLERIDHLLNISELEFEELVTALARGDRKRLSEFVSIFYFFSGERPAFAVFKFDIENDLGKPDWLQRFITRAGLFHHYPYNPDDPAIFALMEYTAGDVVQQALAKGLESCFAIPTVLESMNNPAFCPTPQSSGNGYAIDLRERDCSESRVREILHARFDYSWEHVKRLVKWSGADTPDVEMAAERQLDFLRRISGREDFGAIGE